MSSDHTKRAPALVTAATGASWLALVAATTFGVAEVDCVRAEIRADSAVVPEDGAVYRLIVQSYESAAVGEGDLPGEYARPLTSLQRAVTAEELKEGVFVDLVGTGSRDGSVVVAWIEPGEPDLELDALRARPAPGFFGGTETPSAGKARVVLKRG